MSNMKDALVALVTSRNAVEAQAGMVGHPLHVNLPQSTDARAERQGARIRILKIAISDLERRIENEAAARTPAWTGKLRSLRLELARRHAAAGILETD